MIAYSDTEFLVSLYGQDNYSATASALLKPKPLFLLTPLGEAEFINALQLQVFRKQWTRREARLVQEQFHQHQAAGVFRMQAFTSEVWEKALTLSLRHSARLGTRTLDLLHIAAALLLKPDAF